MSDKLLPCPFCGGGAERVDIDEGENAGGSYICCTSCLASGNIEFEFKENFVANWNRRTSAEGDFAEYDAGLLNDFGGGDVGWWHDYLRAEIARANDFHRERVSTAPDAPAPAGDGWRTAESAPEGVRLLTCRTGEKQATISRRRRLQMPGSPIYDDEWIDDEGRTTVTHSTFLPPTHWRYLPAPVSEPKP